MKICELEKKKNLTRQATLLEYMKPSTSKKKTPVKITLFITMYFFLVSYTLFNIFLLNYVFF